MNDGEATNPKETGTTAFNRPRQPVIHYSARGYDEFRADLGRRLEEGTLVLREEDFLDAFIDLTAYLGEVLMIYQNAYAQEVYLETAQLRESLFNLAAMVDYRVNPGAGATGTLAVLAKPGKSGLLPKGFQVSGKEEGAKQAVFFETDAQLTVDSRFNDFSLAASERFTPISLATTVTALGKLAVTPGQYLFFHAPGADLFAQIQFVQADEAADTTTLSWSAASEYRTSSAPLPVGDGSFTLVTPESRGVLKIASGTVWLDNKYEQIIQDAPVVIRSDGTAKYGRVGAFTFETLLVKTSVSTRIAEAGTSDASLGPYEQKFSEYTIATYGTPASKTYHVIRTVQVEPREVTKLTVTWLNGAPGNYGPVGPGEVTEKSPRHVVFAGIDNPLTVVTVEKNTTSMRGCTSVLVDGDFTGMEKYRQLLFHEVVSGAETLEAAQVLSVSLTGSGGTAKSVIQLVTPLGGDFTKHEVKIWGNVVKASQGKTLPTTTLGNGRGGTPYQSFDLPQGPLTSERQGKGTIRGALSLTVEDLPWEQREDFRESGPEDRHFVIETGFDGKSEVLFGDGVNGARLPTGRDNVTARYRIGQGSEGNVPAKVVKKPTAKPVFLKELFNPDKTAGGADPDKESELRTKIPSEHLTFDRAVSLRDYADLALAYPGVGKAKSGWRWRHGRQYVVLAVYGEHGQDLASILEDLRAYLDARRDTNQPLLVQEVAVVPVRLTIQVVALPGYDVEKVKDAITTSLGTGVDDDGTLQFFNPDRLDIGMSIHAKEIYRLLEQVPGVGRIRELTMERCPPTADGDGVLLPAFCPGDVWIHSWELAELDAARLDVEVEQPPTKAVCERSGG